MTTAQEIIEDGLALVLVDEANIALEPNEFAIGVRFLNDWVAEQFDSGVDIGYRPVSSPGDPVTSPASVNRALKKIVARECAPIFGIPVPADVRQDANEAEDSLISRFFRVTSSRFTTTTPRGSGNSNTRGGNGDRGFGGSFFGSFYNQIALPQAWLRLDASTTVTISTISTPVQVIGPWIIDRDLNTTTTTAGVVTFDTKGLYLANLEANLTLNAASGDEFIFYFTKNGAILEQSRMPFDADKAQNVLVKWVGTAQDTDQFALFVENISNTTDLVITNGHFRVT